MRPDGGQTVCQATWQPHLGEAVLVDEISQILKQKCRQGKASEVEDMLKRYEANGLPAVRRGDYSALWQKAQFL